jgi:hypothetical protein
MKFMRLCAVTAFAIAVSANSQESTPSPAGDTRPTQVSSPERERLEVTLKSYEAAYQHMSLYELQKTWPDLPNQKKEYRKAEDLLTRGNVSKVRINLDVQDVQVNGDNAVVRALRHEEYLKNEQSSFYGGDNSMGRVGTQTPGPVSDSDKKTVKKNQEVTIHLHRQADAWVIASVEENGKHH